MNHFLRIFILIIIATFSHIANAATPYTSLENKAGRFYKYEEWASALAMYELMLDQRPTEIPIYARAIVTSGMIKKADIQLELLQRSQKLGLPVDSIFSTISNDAFAIYRPDIYESFLIMVREKQPWFVRVVNTHLLKYYTFRNESDNMIALSMMLLKGSPDNILYLQTMGDAYCLKGDLQEGMVWYKKILNYDPKNYMALLTLGNYYNNELNLVLENQLEVIPSIPARNEKRISILERRDSVEVKQIAHQAISYLSEANKVKATPYVTKMLSNLNTLLTPATINRNSRK